MVMHKMHRICLEEYKGSTWPTWQRNRYVHWVLCVYHWEITYQKCYVFSWQGGAYAPNATCVATPLPIAELSSLTKLGTVGTYKGNMLVW